MKTLIDKNSLGYFFNIVEDLTETNVIFNVGKSSEFNSSNATLIEAEPPYPPLAGAWKWNGSGWDEYDVEAITKYVEAEKLRQKEEFNAKQKESRAIAYTKESDPLFFKSQRGEATREEWIAKVNEIIARYPYQE